MNHPAPAVGFFLTNSEIRTRGKNTLDPEDLTAILVSIIIIHILENVIFVSPSILPGCMCFDICLLKHFYRFEILVLVHLLFINPKPASSIKLTCLILRIRQVYIVCVLNTSVGIMFKDIK